LLAASSSSLAAVASFVRSPRDVKLKGFLKAAGYLLLIGAVYFAAMKGFGKAIDQYWRQGAPSVEDAYQRSGSSDTVLAEAHNDCKSRTDFVGVSSRRKGDFDGLEMVNAFTGETQLAKAALYVSCLTAHKPPRFCQSAHRKHLSAALDDYYRVLARVGTMRTTLTSPGSVRTALGPPAPAPGTVKTDTRVVLGLRDLIEQGYISRSDISGFFGSLPGDLELALHGVERKRQGCA
jgi:hypothetical protein